MLNLTSRVEYLVAELVALRYDYVRFAILDHLRRFCMAKARAATAPMHFKTMVQADVPQGRHGKHKQIVTTILNDLDQLPDGAALKVPLDALADGKANVRSALNRASRKASRIVATATDDNFLYLWNVKK
jgi:hypothetical protein